MSTICTQPFPDFATVIINNQARLVRLCAYLTNDPQAAEDLAQETLLIAWRQRTHIYDPSGVSRWLNAIAHNVCRHHLRSQSRAAAHLTLPEQLDHTNTCSELAADFDLEVELERAELITLLDRAMGLLPSETRSLLVQHYLEELPQAELAAKVGVSTSALAVRLHRGKLALRHLLSGELSDDAIALGLVTPEATGWRPTRIWCFICGQSYLEAQFNRPEGHLRLRCPRCCNPHNENDFISNANTPLLCNFKTVKPAFNFVENIVHAHYIKHARAGLAPCFQCGQATPIRSGSPPGQPFDSSDLYLWCEACQVGFSTESWGSLALSLPEVRQFWQEHPRMHLLPTRQLVIANTLAVVTGFASSTSQARIEAAFATNTFALIYVE